MSRLMSVALTEQAVLDRRKTVTRRLGWKFLKPGDTLTLCRKVMGRKPGEPLVRIAEVRVVDVRREPLDAITWSDVAREGFPTIYETGDAFYDGDPWTPARFVEFFCEHMKCEPDTEVTRIEWEWDGETA